MQGDIIEKMLPKPEKSLVVWEMGQIRDSKQNIAHLLKVSEVFQFPCKYYHLQEI